MRDSDIGGLSVRGFLSATVPLTLLAVSVYLAVPFRQGSPTGPPPEALLASELGVLRGRLEEVSKQQLAMAQRLEALEKLTLQKRRP